MTNKETRRYEMLVRVRDFGEAHRDLFPKSTPGGEAFAAIAEAVRQLSEHAMAKLSTAEEGKASRNDAREALLGQLTAIVETARAVGPKVPGFNNVFKLPHFKGDSAMMTAGRLFVREAERLEELFVAYGLPGTFVADAASAVDRLEEAVRGRTTGKTLQSAAQAGIGRAIASGLEAARTLDVIVANQFRGDPMTRAAWTAGRRVVAARRVRRAAPADAVKPGSSDTTLKIAS